MLIVRQIQGLQWCIDKEYPRLPTKESDKPIQFWQLKKAGNKVRVNGLVRVLPFDVLFLQTYYYNRKSRPTSLSYLSNTSLVATKTPQEAVPVLGRGALCADSMGLVSL